MPQHIITITNHQDLARGLRIGAPLELRLDKLSLSLNDIKDLCGRLNTPPIFSNRQQDIPLHDLLPLLDWGRVDISASRYASLAPHLQEKPIILSWHESDYPKTLPKAKNAWYKVCPLLTSMPDCLRFLKHIRSFPQQKLIAYVRGQRFRFTRELALTMGQAAQFFAFDEEVAVDGQLIHTMEPYPICQNWFGLIGHPVEHSLSPSYHNSGFAQKNLAAWYVGMDILPHELTKSLALIKELPFKGISITMPHKITCATQEKSEQPAINTLFLHQGWQCANTDQIALKNLLPPGKRVLLLGLGGSGLGIAGAITQAFHIYNRSSHKIPAFREMFPLAEPMTGSTTYDTIINTLPPGADIPENLACDTLINLQYQTQEMPQIRHKKLIDGMTFFHEQAKWQHKLFIKALKTIN